MFPPATLVRTIPDERNEMPTPSERAFWVLRIEVTESEAWDEVPEMLREIADKLSDLPLSETLWDRRGRLLGVSTVEVEEAAAVPSVMRGDPVYGVPYDGQQPEEAT